MSPPSLKTTETEPGGLPWLIGEVRGATMLCSTQLQEEQTLFNCGLWLRGTIVSHVEGVAGGEKEDQESGRPIHREASKKAFS